MPEAQAQVNETPMVELDTGGNAVDVELKENKQQEVQEAEVPDAVSALELSLRDDDGDGAPKEKGGILFS